MEKSNAIVTIVTPTYNRGYKLKDLYSSIQQSIDKEFIWLIIDDGSTDDTEEIVSRWIAESNMQIIYKKKPNGGKHTALNFSYNFIETPLTFIVDSDDTITPNAITLVKEKYNLYKNETDLCGFSFLRGKPDGGYLSSRGVPVNDMKESYIECRINRKIGGDMAEVWFTRCLKEYPFPEFKDEKFLGEDIVWVKMAKKYKLRFYNEVIYISDYLDDGLTKNRRKNNINSPNGCVAVAQTFLNADVIFSRKIKAMLQYIIYGKFAGLLVGKLIKQTSHKFLAIICTGPALILYRRWRATYL